MEQLAYDSIHVRKNLAAAQSAAWRRIAEPGTWWTGAERLAIAAETRNAWSCELCCKRKAAPSPVGVEGEHHSLGRLPEHLVEVTHRLATDPGRLTRSWLAELQDAGLRDAPYVEALALVARVVAMDVFFRAIGVAAPELPAAVAGQPSRSRPEAARVDGAWVPTVAPQDATGPLEGLYEGSFVPNVRRALSLVPEEAREVSRLASAQYLPLRKVLDPAAQPEADQALTRPQMELIASRISALNSCFY